jgi:hypothetical protein
VGNPFASLLVSDPIPLPFDEGQWVKVRKLSGRQIEAAQTAHRGNLASGSARSWAATFRRMLETGASDPDVLHAIADPLTGYDRYALVRFGLVAWSYPQSVTPIAAKPEIKGKPGSPAVEASDAIEDLDDEAVDFIATEVLRLTKPALFHATEEDAETAQREVDPAPSIA